MLMYPKDGEQRSYAVFYHFRGEDVQHYDLNVRATDARRAINKVIHDQQQDV